MQRAEAGQVYECRSPDGPWLVRRALLLWHGRKGMHLWSDSEKCSKAVTPQNCAALHCEQAPEALSAICQLQ